MRFTELDVKGAVLIEIETRRDACGFFAPERERAVRYDDPTVGIRWPGPPCDICAVATTADPAAKRCGGGRVSAASFGSAGQDP